MKSTKIQYLVSLILFYLVLTSLPVFAQKKLHAELRIDKNGGMEAYSRMIFGQFIEHFHRQVYGGIFEPGSKLSDDQGFRKDVIQALRELKVPVVRWPGGCFVSSYHWLDGVGKNRIPAYDKAWHVEDPNTFGTDEYIAWCRKINAEPFICTNAGTGTPEEMSDWIEYCNLNIGKFGRMRIANGHLEPYNVKYWSIGNENYGFWEMGAKTVDEWGYFVREAAKLMFNVDHSIKLFAAALADDNWTTPLLERAGQHLSYVSIHGYWDILNQNYSPSDYISCMLKTTQPEEQIKHTIDILKKTGYDKKIKIAFDEWNLRGWHHPDQGNRIKGQDIAARDKNDSNSTYTMADALFSACFLNSCIRNSEYVAMACMAPIVNTTGPIYVSPEGIVKRTTYHVMNMYANNLQPNIISSFIKSDTLSNGTTSVPAIDAIVTCSDDRKFYSISLVNKHPEREAECDIDLGNIDGNASEFVLSGDSENAFNDVDTPNRVIPIKRSIVIKNGKIILPAHSLVILNIKLPH
ncbi:alpha-L-arabinofuranosidase C-terminal domain-containing protein [Chitinophaga sp. Ak27]|uniref:alpha-L-arabinofuranosidase C-terminal domain-containing protein n=1 Tax=Chitinophaga sp. Ak27 TaxID=2726116 RepID=UPI00145D00F7|nr:alpha-L-arabinofuranosidase C-terminal domain-containing protein [Chitinophaga sp. Ak27]NLU95548.1 alpha-N-arabinofuranosidase [Chitinophaga sp. Ak27]